ncbi:MAG: UDP-N-acetylmuramate dehydrogenase [Anaerovoracaceae bacterium]|jgi:UDP-N-acetylmuramate dehydrogenase
MDNRSQISRRLEEVLRRGELLVDAPMAEYTTFKAGGSADLLAVPGSTDELQETLRVLHEAQCPFMILGRGSNILVRDGGYRGVLVRISSCCSEMTGTGPDFVFGAAVSLAAASRYVQDHDCTGFEFAGGIPGSIGGAAFMNAGAYGGEMKDVVRRVHLLRRDGSERYVLSGAEMEFRYRHSVLCESGDVVTAVEMHLEAGEPALIAAKMKTLQERRSSRQPLSYPSAGSFFKRPTGYYAGKLVQDAGCKGLSVGGAQISTQHAGFMINTGGATATDIEQLMHLVQARVRERFGVMLEPEVRIIGEAAPGGTAAAAPGRSE